MSIKKIKLNRIFYNYFLENKIIAKQKTLSEEAIVNRIEALAKFANACNPGLFNDYRLENILISYGQKSRDFEYPSMYKSLSSNYIVHVVTKLFDVGGHTRVVSQMLERISEPQVLFITQQLTKDIPLWFLKKHSDIKIITYESLNLLNNTCIHRALALRQLTLSVKCVILYSHPEDVIPVLAFSHEKGPIVFFENHQHSWFWLGNSISDVVFSHTSYHEEFTRKHRQIRNSYLLPFTQISDALISEVSAIDKKNAKLELGISTEKICLLTVATKTKFFPLSKEYNIFRLINSILLKFSNVEYIIVGIEDNLKEVKKYSIDTTRAHFVGYQNDLKKYYLAADICIDSIPEPSLGATKQAAVVGKACPLFKYGGSGVFNYNDNLYPLYSEMIGRTVTQDDFLKKLELLVNNPDLRYRIASEFREGFISDLNEIPARLMELLNVSKSMEHQVNIYTTNKDFFTPEVEEISGVFRNMIDYVSFLSIIDILKILALIIKENALLTLIYSLMGRRIFSLRNFNKLRSK